MFENIRADWDRFRRGPDRPPSLYALFELGFWALVVYRFGRWLRRCRVPVLRELLKLVAFALFKTAEIVTGVSLPLSAEIGKGFYVGHFGGIILHSDVRIGENCSVGTGVVIGTRGLGNRGVPVLGNNVYVGVGAKILGGVRIGHDARIGANAVVLRDVPDGGTAVGIPARVVAQREDRQP